MASSERLHAEVEIESLSQERRGPGLSLRQARERCRLTVASVADTLHLEQRVIEALEADDYGRLPPITYVRGYLCAYARLVNLSVADVLQAFERVGLEERSRPLTSKVGSSGGRGMSGISAGSSWLLTVAFAAVLISGWMFWLESQSTPETTAQNENGIEAGMSAATAAAETGADTVPEPASGLDTDTGASASAPESLAAPAGIGSELPPLSDERVGIVVQPVAKLSSIGGLNRAPDATASNANATSAQMLQQDPPVAAAAASGAAEIAARRSDGMATAAVETLKVDATGESWVDVQDAGGQRLVYGLLERGDSRRVTGQPPFAITIGDTTRVLLRHEGARVDLGPYTHGKVARFTLTATRD